MNALIRTAMSVGPVLLGLALLLLPVFYLSWRSARAPKKGLPLPFYLFASLGSGVLMYGVGTAAGIWLACSSPGSSNLCGLAGFFGLGPLLSGLVIVATAFWLVRNARRGADSGPASRS
ncbi:MAG: hypothetical protein KIT13_05155 [Burkholderiales bacterium]|nr:hypothetical protein [Burkholderiales bacterium]MCW5603365.1 hypothetical protein [Burkholderiales bacterium]